MPERGTYADMKWSDTGKVVQYRAEKEDSQW
jgi:hypothetical protein